MSRYRQHSGPEPILIAGVVALGLLTIGLIIGLATHTTPHHGRVTHKYWTTTTYLDEYCTYVDEEWDHRLSGDRSTVWPQDGRGERAGIKRLNCRRKWYDEDCTCWSTNTDGSCTFKTCDDIYKDYCTYETQRWVQVDRRTQQDNTQQPQYPSIPFTNDIQRTRHDAQYTLLLEYKREEEQLQGTHELRTLEEYQTFYEGEVITVMTGAFGGIRAVKHLEMN